MWKIYLFLMANLIAWPAWAAVTHVTGTTTTRDVGGKPYYEFKGLMHGTVPSRVGGTYATPIRVLFPQKANQFNGSAVIVPRSYTIQEVSMVDAGGLTMVPASCTDNLVSDRFIGKRGYVFVEFHWNKYVLDAAASFEPPVPGYDLNGYELCDSHEICDNIQDPMDAHQIVADIASLVKAPPEGLQKMPASNIAIMDGFGGDAAIGREYFLHQYNTNQYSRAHEYDGFVQMNNGPFCWDMNHNTITDPESLTPCFEPIAGVSGVDKVISLNSEGEYQLFGAGFVRLGDQPDYREYDVFGPHYPLDILDLEGVVPPGEYIRQVKAPTFKSREAMTENLRQWITQGTPPPDSVRFSGTTIDGMGNPIPMFTGLPCSPFLGEELAGAPFCDHFGNAPIENGGGGGGFFPVSQLMTLDENGNPLIDARDSDGHVLGGMRTPDIDVPLGEINGLELGDFNGESFQLPSGLSSHPEWFSILAWEASGKFKRFDDATLNTRYKTNKDYVNKVTASALNALNNRWILPEDYVDYVVRAKNCVIGKKVSYTDAEIEACQVFF